jgi:hypothetical protein
VRFQSQEMTNLAPFSALIIGRANRSVKPWKPKLAMRSAGIRLNSTRSFLAAQFAVLAVLFSLADAPLRGGAVIREAGAVYLEDLLVKPVKLATTAEAPIYYLSDLGRFLGVLKKGQLVELQAVSDGAYRVRGTAQQGQVAGWVEPRYLSPLKKEFLDALKQNAARRNEVNALIAKNEVAVNMTPEEVALSLGKPARKNSRLDANGREETWEFVRYERVPQDVTGYDRAGRLVSSVQYVKVPVGKLSVTFANNLVTSLEQSEGTLARDARVKIVPPPFTVSY